MESITQTVNTSGIAEEALRKQKYEAFVNTLVLVIEKYGKDALTSSDSAP